MELNLDHPINQIKVEHLKMKLLKVADVAKPADTSGRSFPYDGPPPPQDRLRHLESFYMSHQ